MHLVLYNKSTLEDSEIADEQEGAGVLRTQQQTVWDRLALGKPEPAIPLHQTHGARSIHECQAASLVKAIELWWPYYIVPSDFSTVLTLVSRFLYTRLQSMFNLYDSKPGLIAKQLS